jgi:uncharacterized membrane protein
VITEEAKAAAIQEQIKARFADQVLSHYNFMDRDQGFITTTDDSGNQQQTPLMSISIGVVSQSEHQFADIREITELAAEARRQDVLSS